MKRGWITAACVMMLALSGCGADQSSLPAQTPNTAAQPQETRQQLQGQDEKLRVELDRTKQEMEAAKQKMESIFADYSKAKTAFETVNSENETFRKENEKLLPLMDQGTLGFFTYVGANDAVDVLKNAKYASSTEIGRPEDATSLENMRASFPHIKTSNILRESEELSAFKITDKMMAIAQSNLNWSDEHQAHSEQFEVAENFISGKESPYQTWYDAEREDEGEHYRILMNADYKLTGFAYCTANRSGENEFSHCQVYAPEGEEEAFDVDAYEERFNEYYNAVLELQTKNADITQRLESAKAEAERLQQSYEEANDAYLTANDAYENAQRVYDWYT